MVHFDSSERQLFLTQDSGVRESSLAPRPPFPREGSAG